MSPELDFVLAKLLCFVVFVCLSISLLILIQLIQKYRKRLSSYSEFFQALEALMEGRVLSSKEKEILSLGLGHLMRMAPKVFD